MKGTGAVMSEAASGQAIPFATEEEYLRFLALKRGESLEELKKWLADSELVPGPCYCTEFPSCRGWRLYYPEELEA
jgi:hypothetical protein